MSNGASGGHIVVLLVEAGFAGLYQLYHLRELGLSARLVDAGSDLGGIWYWNHHQGIDLAQSSTRVGIKGNQE